MSHALPKWELSAKLGRFDMTAHAKYVTCLSVFVVSAIGDPWVVSAQESANAEGYSMSLTATTIKDG